ncbi:MAG: tetratricopeptide repeat-containing sensor histidine kinase [Bacteroidota bacterium]
MPKAITKIKVHLFFFTLLLGNFSAIGQTTKVDELLGQLNKNNTDSVQISIMRKLSIAYSAVDPIKKFYYSNQYRLLAEKNGIDSVVASAFLDMGISHGIRSNLDSALHYFNLGLKKSQETNYTNGIARSYANIGYAFDRLERKKEAVKSYEASLKLYRNLNHKKGISQNIINLGSIYFDLGEYKTAHNYFIQVLEHVKENPTDEIGLGNALFSLGNSNLKLGNIKPSLTFYQKSLALREKIGDLSGIALSNWGIGQIFLKKEEYQKAIKQLNVALKANQTLKNPYQECVILMTLSETYLALKDYKKAESIGELALTRANDSNAKGLTSKALKLLVEISTAQNKFEEALKLQSDYIKVKDSLDHNHTKESVIINDLNRVNSDNKNLVRDNKNIVEKNADYVIAISIITALLIIVAVLLILYYERNEEKKTNNILLKKQKQEIAEVNEELSALNEELITQMNIVSSQNIELEKLNTVKNKFFSIVSHDLRSPLYNLKSLFELYRQGDLNAQELNDLLLKLEETIYNTSGFLDNLLEWSKNQLDGIHIKPSNFSLYQLVTENLNLAESQFKSKSLIIENNINNHIVLFADPNMINIVIRNLLANAIKFCNVGDKITFNAEVNEPNVVFTIIDTGTGIAKERIDKLFKLSHQTSTGTSGERGYQLGLVLCKDMISQNSGKIWLESELGVGTKFYVSLPKAK